MPYADISARQIMMKGGNNDQVEAYVAQPEGAGPFPGIVVIHHMPGWDEWTTEVVRKFAHRGYAAVSTHLYSRLGPGTPEDIAAKARADGGVADAQVMSDVSAAVEYLTSQPTSNGKVGIIGFCSGGRHVYLAACQVDGIDAAVDCWGGGVIADPTTLNEKRPTSPIELTAQMKAPLLGIFGNDDANPNPEQVDKTEEILKQNGKTYEFHRYDGAGHGFFATDRANYRPEQAVDAWGKVFAFYEKYLAPVAQTASAR